MNKFIRTLSAGVILLAGVSASSCGGDTPNSESSSGATHSTPAPVVAANVLSVVVDGGPNTSSNGASVNTLFTTVTICVPGSTTQCQTIDNVQVDTGSYGLRVLGSVLSLSLPVNKASDGNSLVECTVFVDGYSWGPVASADVQLSGETASSVPIQVIGSANFTAVPSDCSGTGSAEDTVATFGANAILGIGVFEQDCGVNCANSAASDFYYSCAQSACTPIAVPLQNQVLNPVPLLTTDNNGTIIELPAVAAAGAGTLTGSLIFGIDTQTNNASGTQTVLTLNDEGNFTSVLNGQSLDASFLDTGSNGYFFNSSSIAVCTDPDFTDFYCPATSQTVSATLTGLNAVTASASFTVGNAQTLTTNNPSFTVLPTLAGTYSGSTSTLDWGLPFYYGRRVATAIELHSSSAGTGPYVAF